MIKERGFSIIELIIAILLISIVSSAAISRILGTNVFDAIAARDQIVSVLRIAQQRAIGHEDVEFTLQLVANEFVMNLHAGIDEIIEPVRIRLASGSIRSDVNNLDSCAIPPDLDNTISDAKPLIVNFDALGDLMSGGVVDGTPAYPVDVNTGVRICLNNDPIMSICISTAGFVSIGDCDA